MLIDCPECSKEVSDKAPSCTNCGIVFEPRDTPISSDTFAESKTEKISQIIWWVWKALLYLLISAALGAAYFFTIGLLICGVGYLIAYGIHLLLGLEPPGESSFSFGIFLFIAWISTPYFGLTRGWRVMNRSTGWKFLAKWENNQSEDQPTSLENASMSEQGTNGLEIKTEFFPLAFFLFFCTPRIEINGKVHEKPWGTHFFALPPGTHKITVYFPYKILGMERCGENSISVDVAKDVVTRVKYHMGTWARSKGSLEVVNK